MSSRKNKVLMIFALMIISMNIFALSQVNALRDNQIVNDDFLPIAVENSADDDILSLVSNIDVPDLTLWDLEVNATRVIALYDLGYLTINDTYVIKNNDNITLPVFRFAYPKSWVKNLVSIIGKANWDDDDYTLNNTQVNLFEVNDYFSIYEVILSPALNNSDLNYKLNVHATFIRPYTLFEYDDTETASEYGYVLKRNGIAFNISMVPLVPVELTYVKSSFSKATDGGIISELAYPVNATIGDASVIFREMSDVQPCNFSAPYDPNDADYAYRGQIGAWLGFYPPIEAISYKRKITIDNWYYAKVEEEITIECFGLRLDEVYDLIHIETLVGYGLQRFSLGIWYAENGKVHDEFGDLGKPTGAADVVQTNQINIYLRVPMIGGDVKTIYVDYNLKLEDLLEFDGTEYILSTTALPECDFFVRNFELELIFPQGSKFQYLTFGNQEVDYNTDYVFSFLKLGRRQSVDFTATNLTSYDDMSLKLGYYMNDLAIYIQPLTFMLIIFVACLLYIGVRTLRKDVIEKVIIVPEVTAEIPIELIQSFVEQYEEKTALQTRITNLDEDRRRKKIKAKEYDQQRKILESKMRELIKKLDLTKRQLKEKGRKYFDVIQKIEVSEEKRTSVERSIQDLRFRYIREKQISKDAYIRILRDYQNQIERFERDIDKEIINLRLLIEHESKEV